LTNVTIGTGVTSIDAFEGCTSLTSVTIPNNVTFIGGEAFTGCTSLTSVTIPSGVTSIDDGGYGKNVVWGAFLGCSGLTNVTIGNGVTSIGRQAFYMCSALTSVTIPSGVTNIGSYAFYGCTGLTNAFFQGNAQPNYEWAFYGTSPQFTIYYPMNAFGWSTPTWNGYPAQPYNYVAPVFTSLMRGLGTVTALFNGLSLGTNYQLQVSTDLGTWNNSGPVFTATNASQAYAQPFYVTNANRLFFRLRSSP